MSPPTPAQSTTPPPPTPPPPEALVAKLVSAPVDDKILDTVIKLAFGKDAMKNAISQSPLIHMMFDFALRASEGNSVADDDKIVTLVLFCKALKACVVNCPAGRKLCNQVDVSVLLLSSIKAHSISGELASEAITTLCAVCMNDEINSTKLKDALVDTDLESFCDGPDRDKEDLQKKCQFLRALVS